MNDAESIEMARGLDGWDLHKLHVDYGARYSVEDLRGGWLAWLRDPDPDAPTLRADTPGELAVLIQAQINRIKPAAGR